MDNNKDNTELMDSETRTQSRRRRSRTVFTGESIKRMEELFDINRYPDIHERESLARELSIPEPRIQVWFQNRRSRSKKSNTKKDDTISGQDDKTSPRDSTGDSHLRPASESESKEHKENMSNRDQTTPVPESHAFNEFSGQVHLEHQPVYMPSNHVTASYREWLPFHYNPTQWQGWSPVLHNENQQNSSGCEVKTNQNHVYTDVTSGVECESETNDAKPKEECIVDRLFRFSKKRQPVASSKRVLDGPEPYTMKVPRIGRSRCSSDDFEIPEERISDRYPASGLFGISLI